MRMTLVISTKIGATIRSFAVTSSGLKIHGVKIEHSDVRDNLFYSLKDSAKFIN